MFFFFFIVSFETEIDSSCLTIGIYRSTILNDSVYISKTVK